MAAGEAAAIAGTIDSRRGPLIFARFARVGVIHAGMADACLSNDDRFLLSLRPTIPPTSIAWRGLPVHHDERLA